MRKSKFNKWDAVEITNKKDVGMIFEIHSQVYPIVADSMIRYVYGIYVGDGEIIYEEETKLKSVREKFEVRVWTLV